MNYLAGNLVISGKTVLLVMTIGLIFTVSLIINISFKKEGSNLIYKANLQAFNKSLEEIEKYFEDKNMRSVCEESVKANNLLILNKPGFEKIEPNYNWLEIGKVLKLIPKQFCNY